MNIKQKEQQERLAAINEFIRVIGSCGRRFLSENSDKSTLVDDPVFSTMELDARGRVWYCDHYTNARVYTHYQGRWRGFTGGGTLRRLVEAFRNYIKKGKMLRKEYFYLDSPWEYGDDILKVKEAAIRLGIAN